MVENPKQTITSTISTITAPVTVQKYTEKQLNDAAALLMEQVPEHAAVLVQELALTYDVPVWQLVCGVLLEAHQCGHLSAFVLDPAWRDGFKAKSTICIHCKAVFTPVRLGQVYCTSTCGEAAEAAKFAEQERISRLREIEAENLNIAKIGALYGNAAANAVRTAMQGARRADMPVPGGTVDGGWGTDTALPIEADVNS